MPSGHLIRGSHNAAGLRAWLCHCTQLSLPNIIIFLPINTYLSGTSVLCQHGAFSHFFRLFSTFGVMHQNVVTLGGVCVCFSKSVGKRRFRNVWVGGGRWSQFCAQSCTREDTQGTGNGPGITHYSESGAPFFWCTSDDLRVSHLAPNRRRCRLPEIRVAKPWWGESFYPRTGLQKPRPQ